ncbi:T9SS type A sorting domain-containing protein [Tamlana flava]|uniref:T9SS type A sorting domain-containing protein n=1 Tax=Tamlana flava TaxID=3158572 RepID=UPI00351B9DF7
MKGLDLKLTGFVILAFLFLSFVVRDEPFYYIPTTIDDFHLPGSQPFQSGTFVSSRQCDNCHGEYDFETEPAFTWRGSMMAHSMRDPLFEASMVIANQDAQFSGDLCLRCHSPGGWLEGRSTPTDGSALTAIDREGVQCHVCHKMMDPLSNDLNDLAYINTLTDKPQVHGNGMFVIDEQDVRRGPYNDITQVNHDVQYSAFHTKSEMCATCHDVSNPVYSKQPDGTYLPNDLGTSATSFDTYDMFPVERTYSEWKMSAYNSPQGIPSDAFGGNLENVISCQDCHMKEVNGKGVNKNYAPVRLDLGQHDLTGGNTFIPLLIKEKYSNDSYIDPDAIDAGILRARYMLQNAATLNLNAYAEENGFEVKVKIINETGHKLPSGYPEGRRMWINLVAYDIDDNIVYESGAYNHSTGVLDMNNTKIYEAKLGMSPEIAAFANDINNGYYIYNAGESFHFALNNMVVKDNRIPPRGFTNANFEAVQAAPVAYSYEDGAYFDTTEYIVPKNTYRIVAKLYYQTVSKEYIEFLRDYNYTNTLGEQLYNLWDSHGKSSPELMREAEFTTSTLNMTLNKTLDNEIMVFPNPASEAINIKIIPNDVTKVSVDFYSLTGKKIRSMNTINITGQNVKIPVNNLRPGMYIIKIKLKGSYISKLLIIN